MRLTRRGQVAVALVVAAVILGWQFGARSLNAVAAPVLAALVVGAFVVSRTDPPAVELSSLDAGFPGETRTLSVSLSGTGLATVSLSLPDGVACERDARRVTLPTTVEYDLELERRGLHRIGPLTVFQRGPLSLLEREVSVPGTTEVAVYPQLYPVEDGSALSDVFLDELEAERQEFDRLREYQPGDPLRRVHWKSSAKYDDFLVKEFAPSKRDETVTVVGTAPEPEVDEMARLAATVVDLALDSGYRVELAVPDGHVPPGQGETHRETVLWTLAQTGPGTIAPVSDDEADVEITFSRRSLVVRIGDREFTASEALERMGTSDEGGTDASSRRPETEVEVRT